MSHRQQYRKGIEWYLWSLYNSYLAMDKEGRRNLYEFIVSLIALYLVGVGQLGGNIAGVIVVAAMGLDLEKLVEAYKRVQSEADKGEKAKRS